MHLNKNSFVFLVRKKGPFGLWLEVPQENLEAPLICTEAPLFREKAPDWEKQVIYKEKSIFLAFGEFHAPKQHLRLNRYALFVYLFLIWLTTVRCKRCVRCSVFFCNIMVFWGSMRQILRGWCGFVAISGSCRSKSERKTRKKLESIHNRHNFAVSIVKNGTQQTPKTTDDTKENINNN